MARRLLVISAMFLMGGIALSVMTHDAWLLVGHIAAAASAVFAAIAVLLLGMSALRGLAAMREPRPPARTVVEPYEQGLTGLDEAPDPVPSPPTDEP